MPLDGRSDSTPAASIAQNISKNSSPQNAAAKTPKHVLKWMSQLSDEQLQQEFRNEMDRRTQRKRSLQEVSIDQANKKAMMVHYPATHQGPCTVRPQESIAPDYTSPPQEQSKKPAILATPQEAQLPPTLKPPPSTKPPSEVWMSCYKRMKAFQHENGHSCVTAKHPDKQLYDWYLRNRKHWNNRLKRNDPSLISDDRIELLVDVGMGAKETGPFDTKADRWNERFEQLRVYQEEHGHCRVTHKQDRELASWVSTQRSSYLARKREAETGVKGRSFALTNERLQKLTSIGFNFENVTLSFATRLQQIIRYKAEHGHTRVPVSFKECDNLGRYVSSIKTRYHEGKVAAENIEQLDAIGFDWSRRHVQSNWKSETI